jgi:hypothetical protein
MDFQFQRDSWQKAMNDLIGSVFFFKTKSILILLICFASELYHQKECDFV